MLRRDGEFGLCGCGSMRELELGNMGSGAGAKKFHNFFHERVSCFCSGLKWIRGCGSNGERNGWGEWGAGVWEWSNSLMSSGSWEWRVWDLGSECGSNRRVGNEAGDGMELRG